MSHAYVLSKSGLVYHLAHTYNADVAFCGVRVIGKGDGSQIITRDTVCQRCEAAGRKRERGLH